MFLHIHIEKALILIAMVLHTLPKDSYIAVHGTAVAFLGKWTPLSRVQGDDVIHNAIQLL